MVLRRENRSGCMGVERAWIAVAAGPITAIALTKIAMIIARRMVAGSVSIRFRILLLTAALPWLPYTTSLQWVTRFTRIPSPDRGGDAIRGDPLQERPRSPS